VALNIVESRERTAMRVLEEMKGAELNET